MIGDNGSSAAARLFDQRWYLARYSDVCAAGLDPLSHWLSFGWREARQPNPYFEPAFYLANNPEVIAAGLNPLLHYINSGDYNGRKPGPHFDPGWYRTAYGVPSSIPAMLHFVKTGLGRELLPTPQLYAVSLMRQYRHYRDTGEDPFAAAIIWAHRSARPLRPDHLVVSTSKLLDANFYLINGTDVYETGLDPIYHFCEFGWREGRKPNAYFDTRWYLKTNPEARRLGINPLTHYILEGEAAGRRPSMYFDPVWYRETYQLADHENALAHYLAHRRSQRFSPNRYFDVSWYVSTHRSEIGPDRDPFFHFFARRRAC